MERGIYPEYSFYVGFLKILIKALPKLCHLMETGNNFIPGQTILFASLLLSYGLLLVVVYFLF
ncbi:hypothetical protein MP477_00670 [Chryseobacterium sp. WG23]|uniref:hypothetical protein n=1 Tax=Chryseobacterium sp. WG23 TaxID=2926910 RepID=UPI00211F3613|nr:hypothetical protein [Chryseobacterium sp. WG23]MCQ9633461.1 hypothetical protein [Chryseobacterium sp. WG23]